MTIKTSRREKRGWDKSPSLSIVFGLSSKTQWLSGLYYADFISFYSPTQLCGGGTTKSNSNELPISVPLSFLTIPKKGIKHFFMTDGGVIPMSWVNCIRGWKSEQLCLNTFKKLRATSCWKVCPTNSLTKEGITS